MSKEIKEQELREIVSRNWKNGDEVGLFEELKKFVCAAVEEERKEILEDFCGEMHLIREKAGKNQLLLLSKISQMFRNLIHTRESKHE